MEDWFSLDVERERERDELEAAGGGSVVWACGGFSLEAEREREEFALAAAEGSDARLCRDRT